MITVDILIAPLRILVTALGTGVLPAENPATMIRSASTDLDEVRRTSAAATSAVQNGWSAEELKKLGIDEPVRVRKPRRREPSRQAGDAGQAVRESD